MMMQQFQIFYGKDCPVDVALWYLAEERIAERRHNYPE